MFRLTPFLIAFCVPGTHSVDVPPAHAPKGDPGDRSDSGQAGAIARDEVLEFLESKGDIEAFVQRAVEYRGLRGVSDGEFASLTQRAGMALIRVGKREAAVELGIDAATQRPCVATFEMLETVSNSANHPTDRKSYLKGMHWLASEKSGNFGQSLRFLGNLAHAEEVCGNIDESLKIRKVIAERFPGEALTASHLLDISRLSLLRGDEETARAYMTMLAEGNFPEQYRTAGQATLDALDQQRAGGRVQEPLAPPPERNRHYVAIASLLTITGVAIYLLIRRRAWKSPRLNS
jgi:hypothetical protein